MPERRSLVSELRQLEEVLEERGMPPGARARVEAQLEQTARRRAAISSFKSRWLPAFTFAAGAALVLAVVGLRFTSDASLPSSPEDRELMGMFTVHGEGCHDRREKADTILEGTCRLVSSQMELHSWEQVRLRNDDGSVRLSEGTAMFDINTVEAGEPPTRIHVSHGTIEVLGTRFTIDQRAHGGHVDLFEGRIRFVALDGTSTEIAPGQRYTWGETFAALTLTPPPTQGVSSSVPASGTVIDEPAEPAPTVVSPLSSESPSPSEPSVAAEDPSTKSDSDRPRKRRASRTRRPASKAAAPLPEGSADEAALIIEEVARLRAAGRYTKAVEVLRRAETSRRWDRRTAQALSYEHGEILERHFADPAAACAHWTRHQARFGEGRYARLVADAQQRLGCE